MSISQDLAVYAKAISEDMEHGASHILKIAAGSLHTALLKNPSATPIEIRGAAKEYALRLVGGQRQMAPILNFCNRLLLIMQDEKNDSNLAKDLRDLSLKVSKDSTDALLSISVHASGLISGSQFMTHSRSSTLLHFMIKIKDREGLAVYVTQSRPGGEGRLLAGELSVAGIRAMLIEDAEALRYLPKSAALLVGADAIIPSGVVNKVGTHLIALAARELGVPIYCMAESIKIWPFDEPILGSITSAASSPMSQIGLFEVVPASVFKLIMLETGPVTFEKISLDRGEVRVAPEIRKLVGI